MSLWFPAVCNTRDREGTTVVTGADFPSAKLIILTMELLNRCNWKVTLNIIESIARVNKRVTYVFNPILLRGYIVIGG